MGQIQRRNAELVDLLSADFINCWIPIDQVVLDETVTSVTFSDIPQNFRALVLSGQVRTSKEAEWDIIRARFNEDAGNNYSFIQVDFCCTATPPPPPPGGGILCGWYTNDVSQQSIDNLAVYSGQGATQMLPYNCYTSGVAAVTAYLDEAAAQVPGIKVWISMRLAALGPPYPSEANWKAFINALKGHSAVKGWYIADEPEYVGPAYATILQYYNWCKESDPDHPVSIAEAWMVWPAFAGPPPCYDIVLMDVYPGWNSGMPTTCSDTVNEFNASVRDSYKWWRDGKIAADGYGVSIGAVALGYGYHPTTGQCQYGIRDLTDNEHRWHTHITTVLGYEECLFWWDMNDPMWIQTNPHSKTLVANRFGEFAQFAVEMENGTTNDPLITVSVPVTKIVYRYGVNNDRHVILAVNISRWDAADNNGEVLNNVQFTLPGGVGPAEVEVLGEGRTIPVIGGVFTDNFAKFEVHAYAFPGTTTFDCERTISSIKAGLCEGNNSLENSFSPFLFRLPGYARTDRVKWLMLLQGGKMGDLSTDSDVCISLSRGLWENLEPITSVTILPETGPDFVPGCIFELYGIL